MEQNNHAYDMENLPAFVPSRPLHYDLNEIEHPYYMFDHRCVGCVVLMCTKPIDPSIMGHVALSGALLDGCFWLPMSLLQGDAMALVIPVRGHLDYEKNYKLRLEGFRMADGKLVDPFEIDLTTRPRPQKDHEYAEHDEVALEAARQGMVLLKNKDGLLPIDPESTLNLFGDGVTNFRIGAVGAGRINPRYSIGLREAILETSQFKLNDELNELYAMPVNQVPSQAVLERAREQSDTALIILTRGTGENIDNNPLPGEYYLSSEEEAMIKAICKAFDQTVVILNTGYPIDMRWTKTYDIKALIYTGLAGQGSPEALCEILDGRTNPSGRLPDTWAWDYFDIPASANFWTRQADEKPILADDNIWVDTCYEEGIYVGYRYFETFGKPVAFPFGYGLGYSEFKLEASAPVQTGQGFKISVTVLNSGSRAGREVVQIYAELPATKQEQPARQLVAFSKTGLLQPGESTVVDVVIKTKLLSSYHPDRQAWLLDPGTTSFYIGANVRDAKACGSFERQTETVLTPVQHTLPCPVPFDEMNQTDKVWPTGSLTRVRKGAIGLSDRSARSWPEVMPLSVELPGEPITFSQLKQDPSLLDAFVAQMDTATLARLNMMYGHGWSMDGKGEAGRLAPADPYDLPDFVCADGNSGVNLNNPNIGMPTSVVLCSTFNPALARKVGRVIGEEAAENDIQMILATAMNIHRNPLCGRHAEYFSEDPYLAGVMAASQVEGLHDAHVSDSVKHVACNNCETARKRNHSLVGERALREIYLRAFEVLLDHVRPDTIMTGYNALNGCMCGSDPILIEGIFREEFGFDGFAMTDWNSYDTVDMVDAVNSGISWLTPGERDNNRVAVLEQALEDGTLTRARLEQNAKRVFAVMIRRLP